MQSPFRVLTVLACLAGAAFYIFIVHSVTSEQPFLNPKLFLDRNFSIGLCLTLMFGMMMYMPMVLLPTLLQNLFYDNSTYFTLTIGGVGTCNLTNNTITPTNVLRIGNSQIDSDSPSVESACELRCSRLPSRILDCNQASGWLRTGRLRARKYQPLASTNITSPASGEKY